MSPSSSSANGYIQFGLVFVVTLGCAFLLFAGTANLRGAKNALQSFVFVTGGGSNTDKSGGATVTTSLGDVTATATGDGPTIVDFTFTLQRVGYDVISQYDSSSAAYKKYAILDDYAAVVEPNVLMKLSVDGDNSETNMYKYTVCFADDTSVCQRGIKYASEPTQELNIRSECSPYDTFRIAVDEYDANGNKIQTKNGMGICLYVRREIRALSDTDQGTVMDTMYTLWSVDEETGQETYGENYHDSNYLLKFHHFNAAWRESDHIHEGNGFLAQHLKMTNIFEASMQSVDASVSLPYWDFTIDSNMGKSAPDSVVFSAPLFGSMTKPSDYSWGFQTTDAIDDGRIPDGRWADLKADMNDAFPDLKAGYGYMRAPWNMNPSPYLTRFAADYQIGVSLPTCTQHYAIIAESADLMDFMYDIENGPHATAHALAGGTYGCDLMMPLYDAGYISDESSLKSICSKWVFYLKEFYRYGYITPNDECTVADDTDSSTCGFTCDDDSLSNLKSNLKNKIQDFTPSDMSDDGWTAWTDFICSGDGQKIFSGDHLESASPADPSFWVMHPTLERLLHARLMAGGFDDETWAADVKEDFVCQKSECYSEDEEDRDYYDVCCFGHFADSQVFDFENGDKTAYIGTTNSEMINSTDPRSSGYNMPYIYDTFSWPHCSGEADIEGFLETLYDSR
jgi:hypothetical protein